MKFHLFSLTLWLALSFVCRAEPLYQSIAASQILDLTHPLHDEMAYWPGGVPFHKERLVDYDQGYRLHKFTLGENTGTHVDAPAHFIENKLTIEALPLRDLVVPLRVIDARMQAAADPDYRLTASDILVWETRHGKIPAHSLVVMNTGWHKKFDNPEAYINHDGDRVMHFPGYSPAAVALLVERDVAGIGIDTLSIDPGNSTDFAAHKVMLRADKYQIENLANLDALPATGAVAVIGVLPVKDGTQAQARIFALLPE
jgi:kynurenine formamidase